MAALKPRARVFFSQVEFYGQFLQSERGARVGGAMKGIKANCQTLRAEIQRRHVSLLLAVPPTLEHSFA